MSFGFGPAAFEPTWDTVFRQEFAEKIRRLHRWALVVVILLIVPFGFGIGTPEDHRGTVSLVVFLRAIPALGVALILTFSPFYSRIAQGLTVFISIGIGALAVWTNLDYPEPQASYRVTISALVVLAFLFLLGKLLVRAAAAAAVLAVGLFMCLAFWWHPLPLEQQALGVAWVVVLCGAGVTAAWQQERFARNEFVLLRLLDEEKRKSENVLLNVLPEAIANRLRERPDLIAETVEDASVLFVDLVGFTPFSAGRSASEVVGFLNEVFSTFDALVEAQGLEKIKTHGDAYMVAGNVLASEPDHLDRMAQLALELLNAGEKWHLQLRIGLHAGPVVAGVIGTRKFLFDLWGETVNLASRLESHGEAGRIQVSDGVAARLSSFVLEERGVVAVKGVGDVRAWWLNGK